MDFSLSEEQKALRDAIIVFARKRLNKDVIERDRDQVFSRELWLECGEMRLQGLSVPEEFGGLGLDPLSCALSLEALGYACEDSGLVFAICAHLLACVVPIEKFGSEEQKARYLPDVSSGRLICANAMTEPNSGSDSFSMTSRAVPEGDSWRINGTKMFISNAPVADLFLVFAVTDSEKGFHGGITAFLVEKDTPGLEVGGKIEKMGLRTSPISEVVLEDVVVSSDTVLGGVGGGSTVFTHSMDWERVCLFAFNVGVMDRLLEKAIEYARTRRQFGKPIAKQQAIAHKVADMKVRLEAARLLIYRAAWNLDRTRMVSLDAAMAKLFVSESLIEGALGTAQILGGYGFMTEFQVERALRDSIAGTVYSGTSEVQRNIIAAWLGL